MLRNVVFIQEQNVSQEDEWDGKDETAIHFLVRNSEQKSIGCARLLTESHKENERREDSSADSSEKQKKFRIGRVAIIKEYRKQGIGTRLIQRVIDTCREQDLSHPIYLHAQTNSIRFYQKLGFCIHGDVFMDAGIPHIEMWYLPNNGFNNGQQTT